MNLDWKSEAEVLQLFARRTSGTYVAPYELHRFIAWVELVLAEGGERPEITMQRADCLQAIRLALDAYLAEAARMVR